MRLFKIILASIFTLAAISAFLGIWPLPQILSLQFTPALLRALKPECAADFVFIAAILVATILFGRIYCEAICPLGVLQSLINKIFHHKTHVRRVCTRLPVTKVQLALKLASLGIFALFIAFGAGAWAGLLDPYAIFGKVITLSMPFAIVGLLVLVLASFGKGRIWCNYVCPVGTILGGIARFSVFKNKVGLGCSNCKACFAASSCENAASSSSRDGVTRREAIMGAAAVAAVEKTTDGGFAPISLPGVPDRPKSVLPPGAIKRSDFHLKCIGCQLCVANCPEHALKASLSLKDFGQVELDFRHGYCRLACTKCGEVCPTGAIKPLTDEMRLHVHMGHAIWKKDLCIRNTKKDNCTACIRRCPVGALHLVEGAIVVDKTACVGCGACEHVCPSRPMPAVFVKGFEVQRVVTPIGEADLAAEMMKLIDDGQSIVVARHGVIIARAKGDGIKPAIDMLDAGKLSGAVVFDRIVGRAAAAIFVSGGVKSVHAKVMSKSAKEFLKANNVTAYPVELVEKIRNRSGNGICPMEKTVENLDKADEMVKNLRSKLIKK